MLSFYLPLVRMSAYAFAGVIGNSSASIILVSLGSLLFVLGTVLRHTLPAADGTTSSNASVGTVDGLRKPAASQIHANAA